MTHADLPEAFPPHQPLTQLADATASLPPAEWQAAFADLQQGKPGPLGSGRGWHALDARQTLISTIGLLPAVCDDPFDYGRIAAAHALSEALGMGAHPVIAQPLLALPTKSLAVGSVARIVAGLAAVCRAFDLELSGGQLREADQPSVGLALTSLAQTAQLKPPGAAHPGDKLIIARGLGSGLCARALAQARLSASQAGEFIAQGTIANSAGPLLACLDGVHALLPVGLSGLLPSLLEMCRLSQLRATLDWHGLPCLPHVAGLLANGYSHPAAAQAWAVCAPSFRCPPALLPAASSLLCAPEFGGVMLVCCAGDTVSEVLSLFLQQGCTQVAVVGEMLRGTPGVSLSD